MPAFNFNDPNAPFNPDNYQDPILLELRQIASEAESFETINRNGIFISHRWANQYNIYTFASGPDALCDYAFDYTMVVYKHRGRTENFYDTITGQPLRTEDVVILLDQLGIDNPAPLDTYWGPFEIEVIPGITETVYLTEGEYAFGGKSILAYTITEEGPEFYTNVSVNLPQVNLDDDQFTIEYTGWRKDLIDQGILAPATNEEPSVRFGNFDQSAAICTLSPSLPTLTI